MVELQTIVCQRQQIPDLHTALLRQHESTGDLERSHLSKLQRLRLDQTRDQHGVENLNQLEYTKRLKQELLAQHAAELKQIPKNVKVRFRIKKLLCYSKVVKSVIS